MSERYDRVAAKLNVIPGSEVILSAAKEGSGRALLPESAQSEISSFARNDALQLLACGSLPESGDKPRTKARVRVTPFSPKGYRLATQRGTGFLDS